MPSDSHSPTRATRGLFLRFLGLFLGALVATSTIVGIQIPLLHPDAQVTINTHELNTSQPSALAWPSVGSAALVIPSLGVARVHHNHVVPIASLTKLMTAYVVLKQLPLSIGSNGPCLTITTDDLSIYEAMKRSDQSSVAVSPGELLCERDLLNGLLVHSASNYADLLAQMVSGDVTTFVSLMNQTAASLGLTHTHYADTSGFSNQSVSTALDQGRLAVLLMKSPLVRSIVDQTNVVLPVAGDVGSFTPYVGIDNVIGVKSGRTAEAGGCDVMAMTFTDGTTTEVAYAVVLGQRGGNLLGPAGDAALALARSGTMNYRVVIKKGTVVGAIGWANAATSLVVAKTLSFSHWSARAPVKARVSVRHFDGLIRQGQVVGFLSLGTSHRVALVAKRTVSPLSLWQRLR